MARKRRLRRILYCFVTIWFLSLIAFIVCLTVSGSELVNSEQNLAEVIDSVEAEVPDDTGDAFTLGLNPDRDYLIIVNDDHEYVFGGDYDRALQRDLIYVTDFQGEATAIEKGANAAFSMLKHDLFEQGIYVELFSGYRTKEAQDWVYDYYGSLDGWADTNKVAKSGFSEHHTGLLLNIVVWWPQIGEWATETPERTATDPEFFNQVHAAFADYGFIDRYPEGKEEITGYPCEPYEIRFVGSSTVAHEIMDNGLCLEEYLTSK